VLKLTTFYTIKANYRYVSLLETSYDNLTSYKAETMVLLLLATDYYNYEWVY